MLLLLLSSAYMAAMFVCSLDRRIITWKMLLSFEMPSLFW
jgi:hypothetical protein